MGMCVLQTERFYSSVCMCTVVCVCMRVWVGVNFVSVDGWCVCVVHVSCVWVPGHASPLKGPMNGGCSSHYNQAPLFCQYISCTSAHVAAKPVRMQVS
eukprot:m.1523874 g.1523874  ORF g.1523874 m.1523874 type:complete len:98 (+) comp25232_c0_seq31:201-494(+)